MTAEPGPVEVDLRELLAEWDGWVTAYYAARTEGDEPPAVPGFALSAMCIQHALRRAIAAEDALAQRADAISAGTGAPSPAEGAGSFGRVVDIDIDWPAEVCDSKLIQPGRRCDAVGPEGVVCQLVYGHAAHFGTPHAWTDRWTPDDTSPDLTHPRDVSTSAPEPDTSAGEDWVTDAHEAAAWKIRAEEAEKALGDHWSADCERLELARRALVDTGWFTAAQVGDDIAPRIIEMHNALRADLDAAKVELAEMSQQVHRVIVAADDRALAAEARAAEAERRIEAALAVCDDTGLDFLMHSADAARGAEWATSAVRAALSAGGTNEGTADV